MDADPVLPPDIPTDPTIGTATISATHVALFAALAQAQAAFAHARKDRENPHFSSKYATLADTLDACRPGLAEAGIAVLQPASTDRGGVVVTTIVAHKSGEWMSCEMWMPSGNGPQQIGSAISYARRYSLQAVLGIASDDDDGNAAQAGAPDEPAPERPKQRSAGKGKRPLQRDDDAERLKVALRDYVDMSGDQRPGREILAEAIGKPWPEQPSAIDRAAAIGGLTQMAMRPAPYDPGDEPPNRADGED